MKKSLSPFAPLLLFGILFAIILPLVVSSHASDVVRGTMHGVGIV